MHSNAGKATCKASKARKGKAMQGSARQGKGFARLEAKQEVRQAKAKKSS
jgi:hypothetical protein